MKYKFETVYEQVWATYIEADSFEDAREMLEEAEWVRDDAGEDALVSSRCCVYDNKDDEDDYTELEWEP